MRNLKRALSLALASVMLLGMMVVGSSAAGYPDVDDNDNVEAIEVLQAIDLMIGDKDTGNFSPDRPVKRAEMAVIVAKLQNLTTSYYVSTCPFTDVSGTFDWARGPVGAAYASGIISGRSATVFDPDATVTAVEAASMLMRVLGYFQHPEDVADGFNLATVRQANQIGLFSGIEGDATTPLTRNQVAKLTWNALQANMVDFKGQLGVEINGVKVGYNGIYEFRSGTDRKYFAISGLGNTTDGTTNQAYIQLGEQRYDGDLRLVDTAADDFDRPSRHWEYNGKEIGTYAKTEQIQEEYTVGVTGKDLYDLLSSATIKEYDIAYYVDGVEDETIKASNMIRTNTKTYDTTGKGVLTQVFVDNNRKEITITSIHTYLAQATADYNEKSGKLSLKVYKVAEPGVAKTVDVEVVPGIEDIKKDDYVLVNWAEIGNKSGAYGKMEVVNVYDPEVMEDQKLTKYSFESYVVDNGTQYDYGEDGVQKNDLGAYNNDELKNHTYNLYFDQYGYMAGVIEYSGQDNYLFLTGYDRPRSNLSIKTADAAAIFLDGTMQTIKVNVTETDKKMWTDADGDGIYKNDDSELDQTQYPLLNSYTDGHPNYNRWFKYSVSGEGSSAVYTLTPIAAGSWLDVAAGSVGSRGINTAYVRLYGDDPANSRAYGNDESVFITVEAKDDAVDGITAPVTTNSAVTAVKDVYTGMDDTDLYVQNTVVEAGQFTDSIFAVMDDEDYVIGAIVVGDAQNSNKNWAYAIKGAKSEEIKDGYTYWDFTAVVDGEIKDLTVKDKYGSVIDKIKDVVGVADIADSGLMKLTYDKDGYVVDAKLWDTVNANSDGGNDKVWENSDFAGKKDVDPDDYNAYNMKWTGADKAVFSGDGRTLYGHADDVGLRLAQNSPVIVVQVEQDSKGNKEIVYDTYSNYLSARQELVNDKSFDGWVSAVIGNKGAQYVVFKETTVKGVTTDDPSMNDKSDIKTITLSAGDGDTIIKGTLSSNAAKDDYKSAYRISGTKPTGAPNSTAPNLLYIPFKTNTAADEVTLVIEDKDGKTVYAETASIAKTGFHYFYVNTGANGSTEKNNASAEGSMAAAPLAAGTYTWTITTADGDFTGTFKH